MRSTGQEIIHKPAAGSGVLPWLADYERMRKEFRWEAGRRLLDGLPSSRGLNIAYEAVDRHALSPDSERVALRWTGRQGQRRDFSYAELRRLTNQFANVLHELGVARGAHVFILSGRIPELYIAMLGTLKFGAVASPLFSAFGPEPIKARMQLGEAEVLVTTEPLYLKKVAAIRDSIPTLRHVLLVGDGDAPTAVPGTRDLRQSLMEVSEAFEIPATSPEDMALVHFTSGTTGRPKGAVHVHEAVVAHHVTGRWVLDLHPGDVFFCTADPGWVTGTSYGILSPLTNAVTSLVDEGDFDPERWYRLLAEERVNVWYTAPTAIRMLMRAGVELAQRRRYPDLRLIASVGEPLNPEAVRWGVRAFGLPIHDNWWQTETGGIMIANYLSMDIKLGSMGKPLPGIEAAIVKRRDDGSVAVLSAPNSQGELALRRGWPSMFRGYLHEEERYRKCFTGEWYLTGDLAYRDADGYYFFVGRSDDVIKSSGHLIGPFEVESALLEHEAVAEAGVIGKPDPLAGEIVKAFVSLKVGFSPSENLQRELLGFARKRLGPAVAPRELSFLPSLPRTRSGKIMRRLLKARELGLPAGDTSTLEGTQP